MNSERLHVPVLVRETTEMLMVKEDGIYVDATVGLGGHAAEILSMLGPGGAFIGIDRDPQALDYARERLGNSRVRLVQGSFSRLEEILASQDIEAIDGIVFDLGVSMLQLKQHERGFSFLSEERLDMRMDPSQELSAWEVVNRYSEKELERILKEYGEEPKAKRIARAIVDRRRKAPLTTGAELAALVMSVYGGRGKTHPATRTFQALRIEVNRELDELKSGLLAALGVLKTGGRMCVISYHSLEDRMVKNFIREQAREGKVKMLTKKPVTPGAGEMRSNPSSRSAKLRGAEKL
ncbi:MAG: 16S rRNA (cytosine(1402)-N(4))-methyltransferase RsmH [Nitrospirota bacterium]